MPCIRVVVQSNGHRCGRFRNMRRGRGKDGQAALPASFGRNPALGPRRARCAGPPCADKQAAHRPDHSPAPATTIALDESRIARLQVRQRYPPSRASMSTTTARSAVSIAKKMTPRLCTAASQAPCGCAGYGQPGMTGGITAMLPAPDPPAGTRRRRPGRSAKSPARGKELCQSRRARRRPAAGPGRCRMRPAAAGCDASPLRDAECASPVRTVPACPAAACRPAGRR